MRDILLSQGFITIVDDEDFDRVARFKWSAFVAKHTVYAMRSIYYAPNIRQTVLLHVFIGEPENGLIVHHEDHNGLNNRRDNLSSMTRQQHNRLRGLNKNRVGMYRGVYPIGIGVYKATISISGKSYHLGTFRSEKDAAIAYDSAARELVGGIRLTLNFPIESK